MEIYIYIFFVSLLRLVLLYYVVIRGDAYEDTPGTITDLELTQFSFSDGKYLLCGDTTDTRVGNTSPLQNLANVSAWQLRFYYSKR